MSRYAQRRDKLRKLIKKAGADALLVTNFLNVTYLTGFTGDDSYLLVNKDGQVLLSDTRYEEQLGDECPGLELVIRGTGTMTMLEAIAKIVGKAKVGRLGVEGASVSYDLFGQIESQLPKVSLVPTSGLVEELREIKDREEIQATRRAVELAERALAVVRASLRPEQSEREVAFEIEHQIRRFGGRGCRFPPIVAVGARAALPHATPTDKLIGDAPFVLIDWGAHERLYMSDLTRVFATGKISPKLERIYGVVLKAQQRAIAAIKPGALMSEVDKAARSVIAKAGHAKHFGHGLGHGVGLEIHESPRLSAKERRPLKAGMIVTVEPGIYLPGWGGVRIEDDVLVTKTGHEVLTSVPKELGQCVIG